MYVLFALRPQPNIAQYQYIDSSFGTYLSNLTIANCFVIGTNAHMIGKAPKTG